MYKAFHLTKHVSWEVASYFTPDCFGFGFDFYARLKGDHVGVSASLRLGCFWLEADIYDIRHAEDKL